MKPWTEKPQIRRYCTFSYWLRPFLCHEFSLNYFFFYICLFHSSVSFFFFFFPQSFSLRFFRYCSLCNVLFFALIFFLLSSLILFLIFFSSSSHFPPSRFLLYPFFPRVFSHHTYAFCFSPSVPLPQTFLYLSFCCVL